jgi:phosphopantothenoylcysteine decarboxylase/phosphopantothenate--cysteine ligase
MVAGPVELPTPDGVQRIDVQTAAQMHAAVMTQLSAHRGSAPHGARDTQSASHPGRFDVFISVAAVADWRVANRSERKLKKTSSGTPPSLVFEPNADILAEVARLPSPPWCVGFAAESEDLERNGQEKRQRKAIPLLVANIGHQTFGRDDNEWLLIDEKGALEGLHKFPQRITEL